MTINCVSFVLVSTIGTIQWDMLANEPKCHLAQFKTEEP